MSDDGWQSPSGISLGANAMLAFNLLRTLVDKGVLTSNEAAHVVTKTADDIRSGSEDGSGEMLGEQTAQIFEQVGEWLLRRP